jgi:hypothetical protein
MASGAAACSGADPGDAGACPVSSVSCEGSHLHDCSSGSVDVGFDCASNSAGACAKFSGADGGQWISCVAAGDGGCTPDPTVTCAEGYASSCPSGVPETLNCQEIFQTVDAGVCNAAATTSGSGWANGCQVTPPACAVDGCNKDTLTGCDLVHGGSFTFDCSTLGKTCAMVSTADPNQAPSAMCVDAVDGGDASDDGGTD